MNFTNFPSGVQIRTTTCATETEFDVALSLWRGDCPHGTNNTAELVAVNEADFFCGVLRYDVTGPEHVEPFYLIVDGETDEEELWQLGGRRRTV